jgi:hypothetical protein
VFDADIAAGAEVRDLCSINGGKLQIPSTKLQTNSNFYALSNNSKTGEKER